MDPGDLPGFLAVGRSGNVALQRSGRTQHAFEFQGGYNIGVVIRIKINAGGIEGLMTGRENYGPDLDGDCFFFLLVVNSVCRTNLRAYPASFAPPELSAVFGVDGVPRRDRLGVIFVYCFALCQPGVVIIYSRARAFLRACPARDALVQADIARVLSDLYLEATLLALNAFNL